MSRTSLLLLLLLFPFKIGRIDQNSCYFSFSLAYFAADNLHTDINKNVDKVSFVI